MADKKKTSEPTASDQVRSVLQSGLKKLALIIPILILGWVIYVMIAKGDPHRNYDTIEQSVDAYNTLVSAFDPGGSVLPNPVDVEYFLGFFDDNSQDFFDANVEQLARRRLVLTPERFDTLSNDGLRSEAMIFLLNYEPLSGIVAVVERRPLEGNREEVIVETRTRQRVTFVYRKDGDIWHMEDFAGALERIESDLAATGPPTE